MADQNTSALKALNDLIATCHDAALDQELLEQARTIAERQRIAVQNDLNTIQNRLSHGKGHHA